MTTGADSVTYTQAIDEVGSPSDAFNWSSTYRPTNPSAGLFGFASDLVDYEFYDGTNWRRPVWTDGTSAVTIGNTTQSTSTTTGALIVSGGVGIAKRLNVAGAIAGTFITMANAGITWSGSSTDGTTLNPYRMTGMVHSGSSTATNEIYLNLMNIGTDTVAMSSATTRKVVGWRMAHNVGAGAVGTRNGFHYQLATTGACSVSFLTAMNTFAIGAHNMGGTNTSRTLSQGDIFGFNCYARADSGCTYTHSVVGFEADVSVRDSTGTYYKAGVQVVSDSADAYPGLCVDFSFGSGAQSGGVGFRDQYIVGGHQTYWPVNQTAIYPTSLFRAYTCQDYLTVAQGVNRGIDLVEATVSDVAFRSQGFSVSGSGAVQIGPGVISSNGTALTLDTPGVTGTGTPTVSAGGSNYAVNDILYYGNGGLCYVATVSGTAVATVTVIRQPYSSGAAPANPLATTTWQVTGQGTGCTLTCSWATTTGLVVSEASTKLGFYGATPVVKPTGVAVSAAGVHAALVTLGLIAA